MYAAIEIGALNEFPRNLENRPNPNQDTSLNLAGNNQTVGLSPMLTMNLS